MRLIRLGHDFSAAAFALMLCGIVTVSGCERKEKVVNVETPAGDIEVERSKDTGEVDIVIEEN